MFLLFMKHDYTWWFYRKSLLWDIDVIEIYQITFLFLQKKKKIVPYYLKCYWGVMKVEVMVRLRGSEKWLPFYGQQQPKPNPQPVSFSARQNGLPFPFLHDWMVYRPSQATIHSSFNKKCNHVTRKWLDDYVSYPLVNTCNVDKLMPTLRPCFWHLSIT